ncbi:hypothetical protein JYU19_02745, partial [bacterium AH-315-J21]|nr:hypothetical protein [bacterium AH-315-J21]
MNTRPTNPTIKLAVISILGSVASLIGFLEDYYIGRLSIVSQHLAITYIVLFVSIVAYNGLRLSNLAPQRDSWNPTHHIPTAAAWIRVTVSILLILPVLSPSLSVWPAFTYLSYILVLVSTYDRPRYHYVRNRWIRILVDTGFGVWIFASYGGLTNAAWLIFILPIAILGRYYNAKWARAWTLLVIVFIVVMSTLISPTIPLRELLKILQDIGTGFSTYRANTSNLNYWYAFNELLASIVVYLIIYGIYFAEVKNRLMGIFDFHGRLAEHIKRNPSKEVDESLLRFLCDRINVEIVVSIKLDYLDSVNRKIPIAVVLQTHDVNHQYVYKTVDISLVSSVNRWLEDFDVRFESPCESLTIENNSNAVLQLKEMLFDKGSVLRLERDKLDVLYD